MFFFDDELATKFPAPCGQVNAGWQAHFKCPMALDDILAPPTTGENSYDDEEMTWLYQSAKYYTHRVRPPNFCISPIPRASLTSVTVVAGGGGASVARNRQSSREGPGPRPGGRRRRRRRRLQRRRREGDPPPPPPVMRACATVTPSPPAPAPAPATLPVAGQSRSWKVPAPCGLPPGPAAGGRCSPQTKTVN